MRLTSTWAASPIAPKSSRKVWWSSGMCKTGQPHKWEAVI